MKPVVYLLVFFAACGTGCKSNHAGANSMDVIGAGHAPSIAKDKDRNLHVAYCTGDSIMYSYSGNQGRSFTAPVLVSVLPHLASINSRGPQIGISSLGVTIIAGGNKGNIYSFEKDGKGNWRQTARVNDRDSSAREGQIALGGDGSILYAVWLDLRAGHNQVFGAASADGGESWSENKLIYASPNSPVCQCCKPSVAVKGNKVFVMFRNLLDGNRDLYLIQSDDGGKVFHQAVKLGNGSWKLNGCPMDGGSLVIGENGNPDTVWRRQNKIYSCEPGKPEQEIAEGRNCSMTILNGKKAYVWNEKGKIISLLPDNKKQTLGEGALPVIKAINREKAICIWENGRQIHTAVLSM
jgi:hypothetical protein